MSTDQPQQPLARPQDSSVPLSRILNQSEQVQAQVTQAAAALSSVSADLKDEMTVGVTMVKIELAQNEIEVVEADVQEAAENLAAVNDAWAAQIDRRNDLERRLSRSNAALSESRAEERRARRSALHDALTGLPNITLFNDRLSNAVAHARRHTRRLAVLFIDLDGFKRVNDTHGHDIGDVMLKRVAERLGALVRTSDTVSRRGGDEFVILILEPDDPSNLSNLTARIADGVAAETKIDNVTLSVTASIGIALFPEHGQSAPMLLKNADMAMYTQKHQKRAPGM